MTSVLKSRYKTKIILDSVSPVGSRLTTFELTYPRFVHSEFMTHRMFSRNAASSRAIPVRKMIEAVRTDPVIPVYWGTSQSGMQAGDESSEKELSLKVWLDARDRMAETAEILSGLVRVNRHTGGWVSDEAEDCPPVITRLNLHKQIVNRILEPWL